MKKLSRLKTGENGILQHVSGAPGLVLVENSRHRPAGVKVFLLPRGVSRAQGTFLGLHPCDAWQKDKQILRAALGGEAGPPNATDHSTHLLHVEEEKLAPWGEGVLEGSPSVHADPLEIHREDDSHEGEAAGTHGIWAESPRGSRAGGSFARVLDPSLLER